MYNAEYYIQHREKMLEQGRVWSQTHREQRRAIGKRYYDRHLDKMRLRRKNYKMQHPERKCADDKKYRENHKAQQQNEDDDVNYVWASTAFLVIALTGIGASIILMKNRRN
jgi:hypothetical protein